MRVGRLINVDKSGVAFSAWSDEKLRTRDFPLSKKRGKAHPFSRRYRWQVITFLAFGRNFRALVAYHTLAPEFIVSLGEDVGGDVRMLARWEFHGTHPGWHVHTVCDDVDKLPVGIVKPAGTRRIPRPASYHRHMELLNPGCAMGDEVATAIGCSLIGITRQHDMLIEDAMPWA